MAHGQGNQVRLTTVTVEATETVVDQTAKVVAFIQVAAADRFFDLDEQRELIQIAGTAHEESVDAYRASMEADEACALGLAIIRRGQNSSRARRLGYAPEAA